MLKTLLARWHQGHRTNKYPAITPALPKRFRGVPAIQDCICEADCNTCIDACPTKALSKNNGIALDLGACIFCAECEKACSNHAVTFTNNHELSSRTRSGLIVTKDTVSIACKEFDKQMKRVFGRSLKLRQVSAGGCNACEADINVLSTVAWDLGRFGIQVVASPRHADGLIITGPVTQNMKLALQKTYDALARPKLVIAVGACAISGGIYRHSPDQNCGAEGMFPIDLYIPGCPPHPLTILHGLLALLGKL